MSGNEDIALRRAFYDQSFCILKISGLRIGIRDEPDVSVFIFHVEAEDVPLAIIAVMPFLYPVADNVCTGACGMRFLEAHVAADLLAEVSEQQGTESEQQNDTDYGLRFHDDVAEGVNSMRAN